MVHGWAGAGRQSLREITRQDLADALSTRAAQQRHALVAMHSLFRMLKGRRVIFANPASRLRCAPLDNSSSIGNQNPGNPLLLTVDVLRDAIHGRQAGRAALAALIAFHALRAGQLASLKLTNIRDSRLGLPVRDVPLAPPVHDLLAAWLDERARRWPGTTNPYLFIDWYTAVRECPVSRPWVGVTLGVSAQAIREDRILHEAQATGGDIRRPCDLFGLTVGGAKRYTRTISEPT